MSIKALVLFLSEVGDLVLKSSCGLVIDVNLDNLSAIDCLGHSISASKLDLTTFIIEFLSDSLVSTEVAQSFLADRDHLRHEVPEKWLGIWWCSQGASVDISFTHVQIFEEILVEINWLIMEKLFEESVCKGLYVIVIMCPISGLENNADDSSNELILGVLI